MVCLKVMLIIETTLSEVRPILAQVISGMLSDSTMIRFVIVWLLGESQSHDASGEK